MGKFAPFVVVWPGGCFTLVSVSVRAPGSVWVSVRVCVGVGVCVRVRARARVRVCVCVARLERLLETKRGITPNHRTPSTRPELFGNGLSVTMVLAEFIKIKHVLRALCESHAYSKHVLTWPDPALHLVGVLLGDGRADGDARDHRAADFVDAPTRHKCIHIHQ